MVPCPRFTGPAGSVVQPNGTMARVIRVGISGWRYAGWRGAFYPPGLVQRRELAYAAERLNSIELNGSFYALQRPDRYRQWRLETPEGFVFSVKGGRFITHMKKLAGLETALPNFFASGVLALRYARLWRAALRYARLWRAGFTVRTPLACWLYGTHASGVLMINY